MTKKQQVVVVDATEGGAAIDEVIQQSMDEPVPAQPAQSNARRKLLVAAVSRYYGSVTITFAVGEWCDLNSWNEQREEWDKLAAQVEGEHEHFATETLPKMRKLP